MHLPAQNNLREHVFLRWRVRFTKKFLHAGTPAACHTYRDIANRCYCFGVVFKFDVTFLCLICEMECRVLSIQSHVVRGYVGNKSASFPLQVRIVLPSIYLCIPFDQPLCVCMLSATTRPMGDYVRLKYRDIPNPSPSLIKHDYILLFDINSTW
jgi:hypothetical protein